MRFMLIFAGVIVASAILFTAYVRLAPSAPAVWHVDPRGVSDLPDQGRYMLRDGEGDGPAPRYSGTPTEIMTRFDAIAMSQSRITRLAGSVEAGHVTYVARSAGFGFPDYISVVAYADGDQTALAIYARLRFGKSDLGVNQKRITAWLAQMTPVS